MSSNVKFDIFANDKTAQVFNKIKGNVDSVAASVKKIGIAAAAVVAGGLASLVVGLKKVTDYAGVQEEAEATLAAVLKTTGEAAGYNTEQLKTMASSLQAVTTYGDETILSGMGILATFKNVSGEAFERATKAGLDMSTVMKQDLKSSMMQLGKALNDPVAGVTRLTDVGVTFTDQQKEQIKALQESGDLLGAQNVMLQELESEFGGAAEAAAGTFKGALTQLSNTWGDLLESLGFVITKNEYFFDLIKQGQKIVEGWIESINAWAAENDVILAQKFDEYLWTVIDTAKEMAPVFENIWVVIKYGALVLADITRAIIDLVSWIRQGLNWISNLMKKIEAFNAKVYDALPSWLQFGNGNETALANRKAVLGYASGTGLSGLPNDGLFYGHKGEIVKNPSESEAERSGRGSGGNTTVNLNVQYMSGDNNAARNVARDLQRLLNSQNARWGTV